MSPKKRPSWADQGPPSSGSSQRLSGSSQRLSGSSQSHVSTDSQASAASANAEIVADGAENQQQTTTRTPSAQERRALRRRSGRVAQSVLLAKRQAKIQEVANAYGRSLLEMSNPPDFNLSRREWNKQFGAWKQQQRRLFRGKGSGKTKSKGKQGKKGKRRGQS